jgi:hypothetical protein
MLNVFKHDDTVSTDVTPVPSQQTQVVDTIAPIYPRLRDVLMNVSREDTEKKVTQ